MDDAAAVRDAAHGHVVETQPVEERGDGVDHLGGPQHVAAEIEDDGVRLRLGLGGGQAPPALVWRGHEVVQHLHLAEVLAVVERHGR